MSLVKCFECCGRGWVMGPFRVRMLCGRCLGERYEQEPVPYSQPGEE